MSGSWVTLSKPSLQRRSPRAGPIPAISMQDFCPIGSLMKFLCFCDVDDILKDCDDDTVTRIDTAIQLVLLRLLNMLILKRIR